MKKKIVTVRNSFFLLLGLFVIGFSSYRVVSSINNPSVDMINGEEIVVVSENTPVALDSQIINENGTQEQAVNTTQMESSSIDTTNNPSISTEVPTQSSSSNLSGQDTFLTQIEKKPENINSQRLIPDRIIIPTIQLNAPVISAGSQKVKVSDQTFDQWVAPNQFAGGWHGSSAYLDDKGNTVINGHHNEYGKVFGNLINLNPGEKIFVLSGDKMFTYIISNKMILKEKNADLQTRLSNSSWIQPSNDERLTLITCWPPESNTHRLIVVAVPYITSPERVFG
jgi:LPXTG-site transpeptidase (sortase) family protein